MAGQQLAMGWQTRTALENKDSFYYAIVVLWKGRLRTHVVDLRPTTKLRHLDNRIGYNRRWLVGFSSFPTHTPALSVNPNP